MKDIRKLAKGMPCHLRFLGCRIDTETVVLAHIRRGSIAGIGQKPVDICALPACDHCHSIYDGRVPSPHSRLEMDADALRGLCQWLTHLAKIGAIST